MMTFSRDDVSMQECCDLLLITNFHRSSIITKVTVIALPDPAPENHIPNAVSLDFTSDKCPLYEYHKSVIATTIHD